MNEMDSNLFSQNVVILKYESFDSHGEYVVDTTGKRYRARIQHTQRRMMDLKGNKLVSEMQIFLPGDVDISTRDQVKIGSISYPIFSVVPHYGESGVEMTELRL